MKRWANDRWTPLGGRIGHAYDQLGARWPEGYSPAIAVLDRTPYVAWYEGGGYGWGEVGGRGIRSSVFVAHWDGSQWVIHRNPEQPHGALNAKPGPTTDDVAAAARDPRLAVVGQVLYAAWIETRRAPNSIVYNAVVVKHLEQGRWVQDGPELSLSRGQAYAWIVDLALADAGGALHVAWSEFSRGKEAKPAAVQVAKLSGGQWSNLGPPVSASPKGNAPYLALSAHAGLPVLAWQEREDPGNSVIYVRRWDGRQWQSLGKALNQDPARGEAGRPALGSDGSRLWLAWTEGAAGRPAGLYVRSLGPAGWSEPTGPLNADAAGAADSPVLVGGRGRVYLAWAEKNPPPATKQVYVRPIQ